MEAKNVPTVAKTIWTCIAEKLLFHGLGDLKFTPKSKI